MRGGPTGREQAAAVAVWAVIVGLGIGAGEGWRWARAIGAVLTVIWLLFVAIPWLHWYFRGGTHRAEPGSDPPPRTPGP